MYGLRFDDIAVQLLAVGHSPNSVPSVRGVNGASWNNKRPCGVTLSFQVRKHVVEAHADVPSNILSNDPRGPEFSHEPIKFWPEVAVIFLASSLPGSGERLAWVSAANNVNWSVNVRSFQCPHVRKARHIRPMLGQYRTGKWLILAECYRLKAASAL
jgi:hypothetical protein